MATIVTRSGKGSPLTNTEVDANFTNLNSDKLETSAAYVHPTGNGNNHIPSDGASGQILGYSSAGTAQWQAAPAADPTRGTLTKSFTSGETASITLSAAVSPAPVVSAIKEVPQSGISSKGAWDVSSTGTNYDRLNSAYNTTLTPNTEGWDISTASYSQNFSVSSQTGSPAGVFFKPDGSKMYVIGDSGGSDAVYEYNLSTAWDVSTASYSQNFSVQIEEHSPTDLFFKPDGSKMYIVGTKASEVNEYNLSTAWDISTASHNQSKSVNSEERYVQCLFFKPDGSKMYVTGFYYARVHEYDLSTAWDISTASINQNFAVNSQDGSPMGISFKPNGTKMYILGDSNDKIYEYNLSTAWDVSTASFLQNFSTYSQESNSRGMFFKPDGIKMYVVGNSGDDVNEYNLASSSLLLLGTGSFATADIGKTIKGNGGVALLAAADGSYVATTAFTDSSTIAAGSWSMNSVAINATNGLEMSNGISGAWDVSKAVHLQLFSFSSQEQVPTGISFKTDGTKMYMCGTQGDDVNEYNLSTAWDVSTAVYSQAFFTGNQISNPEGLYISPDGTKMYVCKNSNVREYTLGTAWDVSTSTYIGTISVSSYETDMKDLFFSYDGTKLYVTGHSADAVIEYTLSTAWDVSTGNYTRSFSLTSQSDPANLPQGLYFSPDGLKMYVVDYYNDDVHEYNLSTAWNVSTASHNYDFNYSIGSSVVNLVAVFFKPDGAKMYLVDQSVYSVSEFNVGTTVSGTGYVPSVTNSGGQIDSQFWTDINSMTTDEIANAGAVHYAVSTDNHATWSVIKEGSGVRPIVRNNSGTWQYNSSESLTFNLATASQDSKYSVNSEQGNPKDLFLSVDGTKMYVTGDTSDEVNEYSLSTAWDITTSQFVYRLDVGAQTSDPQGIFFKPDGTRMYIIAADNPDYVWQYNLSTAWDISTATYTSGDRIATGSQDGYGAAVFFKPDGTKMYTLGNDYDYVYQYALSTAWQVNTASYESKSFNVFSPSNFGDSDPMGLFIRSDGLKFFITGWSTDKVWQFSMSTAWDISTASSDNVSTSTFQTLDSGSQETYPNGVFFKPDMTKMYIVGQSTDFVRQFSVGTLNFTTSTTWANSTTNSELYALQQALTDVSINRMDKAQLEAVTDPNHYTLGDSLDLMISLNLASASSDAPSSDGVSINYDAATINQGAVLGTDYNYDFPNSTTVRVTSSAAQNLKVRVV